ncbi:MAG: hypothetical protein E7644_05720 [Ruminococcaceae bacterium]|nr:hypothetical protein [Oscillospiraceae bacterium]
MKQKRIWIIITSAVLATAMIITGSYQIWKWCFKPLEFRNYSIALTYNMAYMAEYLGETEAVERIGKKVKRHINRMVIKETDDISNIVDVYELLWLCEKFELSFDAKEGLMHHLRKFYIEKVDMFGDTDVKYGAPYETIIWTISWMFLRDCPQILDYEEFSYREGILRGAENYVLHYPEENYGTIWGSGGGLIMTLWYLSYCDGVDYSYLLPEDVEKWYAAWEAYEPDSNYETKNYYGLSILGVALGKEEKGKYFQDIYNQLTDASRLELNGLTTVMSYLECNCVDITENEVFTESLRQRIRELSKSFKFIYVD